MLQREKIYLDTSVPSAYFDRRAKERQKATIKFWNNILPNYQTYISDITVEELENTKDAILRQNLSNFIARFQILKTNDRIKDLASTYIQHHVFPEKYFEDALHVAIASYYEISYLISWNFEHLVKVKTKSLVKLVNIISGFREIEIISPQEL
ncbi:PIN domain-containing protein [candidate division KSB1 bacterium]|nr:PIN domain-containing protein [candidate division KSB1 bacterium]